MRHYSFFLFAQDKSQLSNMRSNIQNQFLCLTKHNMFINSSYGSFRFNRGHRQSLNTVSHICCHSWGLITNPPSGLKAGTHTVLIRRRQNTHTGSSVCLSKLRAFLPKKENKLTWNGGLRPSNFRNIKARYSPWIMRTWVISCVLVVWLKAYSSINHKFRGQEHTVTTSRSTSITTTAGSTVQTLEQVCRKMV